MALRSASAVSRRIYGRFCAVEDDWMGVLVGLTVLVGVSVLGVPVP